MQNIGWQPQRAPDGTPVHYERHRPEQTTLYRLIGDPEYKIGRPRQLYVGSGRHDVPPVVQR